MSKNKPYNEEKDEFGVIRRTFCETTDSDEFVWHRDHEDRVVIPLAENNWMLQFDNELPIKLNVNEEYFIPKNTFHRVIKGSGNLMVEIIETTFEPDEYEILGEGKKKSGGKKDACYYKVKSRYKVWPSAYACVPENTSKALTRNGWKSVQELNIGDEIMTYNIENDELEFKPILNLHRYKDVKTNVVRSGNNGFIFEATDNHKWVVKLPEIKGKRLGKYKRITDKALIETSDLLANKNNKHLVVSAQYNGGKNIKLDKIFKYGTNWIKYILDITNEQRQAWLFSSIVYDGDQKKIERLTENTDNIEELDWLYTGPHGKQSFGFKQKDIEHRDAFLLSAFLNSGLVTWKKVKDKDIYSCHYSSNKRFKNTSNFKLVKENISDVWCPETENGTWVMMQETDGSGIITITGNSGALVKCRKVGAKNWGNKTKEGIKSRLKTLNEISSSDAYNKFYANLFDRENPDNDRLIYNKIIQLDPTFKSQTDKLGMYTKWLFRKDNIESLKNTKDEDLYKIKSDLEFFHNAKTKNLLPPESKDINKFNIKTLLDLVFDMQKSGEDLMSKTEKEKEIKSEVDKYELDDWTVIVPKTEEASCYYGKGTRWCTAADNNNMFDTYSYDGPLYILIGKHDKSDKYQFHFESSQFMDAKDNPINLSEFMNDNSDVYEFFNGRVGGNLDFEIAKSSLENYDEYGFQDFYSDDFTDKQKKELVRLAFDQDEQSDYFYNVSNVLNYVDYPNMKSDFRDSFIWGLEVSLGNSYDEENYDARMFINYLGGFNSENISTIVKAADLKDVDQINKLFEIASEYNGEKLLSDYLENEDVNINFDMIKTIGDIKDKFNYSDWRKTVESDLVKIRFNSFDLENGTINITIVPKDENKEPISDKAESGNIKYQNLIKYLTNRQLFNEAKKKRKLTAKPSSEKNLGDWFARKGGKGKSKGWVDCNTCRKDKKTGRNKCKPCGRKEGEKRAKYPACRPTPSACKTKGKGKRWGKKSVNENVNKQTINKFLSDFGFFITLNLAKVQSYAKTDEAKNKLAEMQSNLNKFSKNYTKLIDPTINKNLYDPKVLSQIIGQIGKYINYIKPHIETLVEDSDIKIDWLAKIQDLSDRYSTIIGKPNENRVHLIKNMLNENSEMLDVVEVFSIYNSNSVHTVEPDVKPAEVPTKPTDSPYAPSIRPKTKPKAIK